MYLFVLHAGSAECGLKVSYQDDETLEERTERNRERAIKKYTPILEEMGIDMNNVTFQPLPDNLQL